MHTEKSLESKESKAVVPLPRLVIRIAFAGNRLLPDSGMAKISDSLTQVWDCIRVCLSDLHRQNDQGQRGRLVANFFAKEKPLLRLVTGLAEGADILAWKTLKKASEAYWKGEVDVELAAVLPCSLEKYRNQDGKGPWDSLDEQAARCVYRVELDGCMDKPSPATDDSQRRRERGFRAQSSLLLRHADLLVAVANPESGKPGGTMETVQKALAFDLPVIFVHSGVVADEKCGTKENSDKSGQIRVLDPDADFYEVLSSDAPSASLCLQTLKDRVQVLLADVDLAPGNKGETLLNEFFYNSKTPHKDEKGKRKPTAVETSWTSFEDWFKIPPSEKKERRSGDDPTVKEWRDRASNLNSHYAGIYRGTFFVNFRRAVCAVVCAAATSFMLGQFMAGLCGEVPDPQSHSRPFPSEYDLSAPRNSLAAMQEIGMRENKITEEGPQSEPHEELGGLTGSQITILLGLALAEFYLVGRIFSSTHTVNHHSINELAVDYRYIAERLRSMFYLPLVGSFLPPAAFESQYASRVERQGAADWLVDSIVRSLSPAFKAEDQSQPTVCNVEPEVSLKALKSWVEDQSDYHLRNSHKMRELSAWAKKWGDRMGKAVLVIVGLDVISLLLHVFGAPAGVCHLLHGAAPYLVFWTTALPAAMASLNGIRFQSECHRLADRSSFMALRLTGESDIGEKPPPSNRRKEIDDLIGDINGDFRKLGGWSAEALRLTELVATDFTKEATEWTVLYGKEIHEQ